MSSSTAATTWALSTSSSDREMDGFETASLIRARKRSQHTPILFLTAFKSDEQLYRGYDLGAVDFLFRSENGWVRNSVADSRAEALATHADPVLDGLQER